MDPNAILHEIQLAWKAPIKALKLFGIFWEQRGWLSR
jgi:hypothetical protein